MPVPEFFCHASCDHHDFNYWLGCTEEDRKKADDQFYTEMQRDATGNPWRQMVAWLYYQFVRRFGVAYFHYADKERDAIDLAKVMYGRE